MRRHDFKELTRIKPVICLVVLLAALFAKLGCSSLTFSTAGLDQEISAGSLPISTGEYGNFVIYKVGEGKIKTLGTQSSEHNLIYYHVADFKYLPSTDPSVAGQKVYNISHCGDGYDMSSNNVLDPGESIFYMDYNLAEPPGCPRDPRRSSDHPDAVVVDRSLKVYYTNHPANLLDLGTGVEQISCKCRNNACGPISSGKVGDGIQNGLVTTDFIDTPDLSQGLTATPSVMGGFNCAIGDDLQPPSMHGGTPDVDWIYIPFSTMGYGHSVPIKFRMQGDSLNMQGLRTVQMSLYEVAAGDSTGVFYANNVPPVTINRFGLDYYRTRDPVLGYILNTSHDYWLQISDWTAQNGITPTLEYKTVIYAEATPTEPLSWDVTSAIYRATVRPARSGNLNLDDGEHFTPDDPITRVQDLYPDCDGIPGSGDEGDWGITEACPVEGNQHVSASDKTGVRDGVMEWWEVDNKANIDDGNYFTGTQTNLSSMGNEAPSVVEVGGALWMFVSTGSGIFQLTSMDGHKGLKWNLSNIYNNRPSLLPRTLDPSAPGDPDAPVVSSGKYGFCDTDKQGDDIQVTPKGKGFANSVCVTFGDDGVMNSYAMEDDAANGSINSGSDGVINTFIFPKCVASLPPVFPGGTEQLTEAPGNPDLACGDSVPGSDDYSAFLLGDDEWATNQIGINPPEYWRRQHCTLFSMADNFERCALGKSNTWMATATSAARCRIR